jgi:RNA polymerase sigma factor (sigma-70 family)
VAASTLTHATRRGLLSRRAPVLKLERDERLVALIRAGHEGAFDTLFNRYQARLLAFCTSMLKSRQDAEDVLQEVFANAHKAMLADERKINVRPWLYRIARNRCLNHLRKPVPEGQDSMDVHPHLNGTTTAERVQKREELRQVLSDVGTLPETQRTALLLREIDQLSYEDIAVAMETTIPAVKSLLVRARITLAESSQARTLSCDEVRLTLAEAAEGISKADGPVRIHVRGCESCAEFRDQLRSDRKALAAIFPVGPLALLKTGLLGKIFGAGGAGAGASGSAAGGTAASAGTAVGAVGGTAAAGSTATAGGLGAIGGAIGTKAAAGVATAALITAGAVEVKHEIADPAPAPVIERAESPPPAQKGPDKERKFAGKLLAASATVGAAAGVEQAAEPAVAAATEVAPVAETAPAIEPAGAGDVPEREAPAGDPGGEQFEEEVTEPVDPVSERDSDGSVDPVGGQIGAPEPPPKDDSGEATPPPAPPKPPATAGPQPGNLVGPEKNGAEGSDAVAPPAD